MIQFEISGYCVNWGRRALFDCLSSNIKYVEVWNTEMANTAKITSEFVPSWNNYFWFSGLGNWHLKLLMSVDCFNLLDETNRAFVRNRDGEDIDLSHFERIRRESAGSRQLIFGLANTRLADQGHVDICIRSSIIDQDSAHLNGISWVWKYTALQWFASISVIVFDISPLPCMIWGLTSHGFRFSAVFIR